MFGTIICDASHCPKTKAAGWAAWIRVGNILIRDWGNFKKLPPNSTVAEYICCKISLGIARRAGATKILLQNDNTEALRKIDELGYPNVTTRHVKGHTNNPDPRFYVNRWCDNIAKIQMRKQRGLINGKRK